MAANTLKTIITADSQGFVKGARQAQQSVEKLGKESKKTAQNIKTISGAANAEKRIINELAYQYHKLTDEEKKAFGSDIKRQMDAHIAKLKEYKAVQADINNQVAGATSKFSAFGSTVGQVGSRLGLPIGNLTALLNPTTAAIAGVVALGAAFVATAKKTERFNSELNNLSARINIPKEELKIFGDEALSIGNKFAKSGEEIVKQFNFIAQQLPGIQNNKKGLFELTEAVNMLSIGMNTDLQTATNAVVTTMSKFNLAAAESTNVANALAEVSRGTGASLEYQAQVFEKVGSAANAVKIPYTDIAAATGVLSSTFSDAGQVGGALLAMINKLGKQKDEFNPAIVGMQQAVENLKNAHLSYADIASMVGPRAAQVVSVLIEQSDAFEELADKAKNTAAAEEMFGIKSEELGFIINKVKTMWSNFVVQIGESEGFKAIMGVIRDIITWIEELSGEIQAFFKNTEIGSGYADMWNMIREALKAILPIIGAVIKVFLVLQSTIQKVISFIIEAIIEWNTMVVEAFKYIYDYAVEIWNKLKDFVVDIWHKLVDPVVEFVNKVKELIGAVWNNVKTTFDAVFDKIVTVFQAVVRPIMNVVNKIIGFFKTLWENIKSIFNSIYEKISDTAVFRAIVKVYKWFKDKVTQLIKIVQDAWNSFLDAVGIGGGKSFKEVKDSSGDEPPSSTPVSTAAPTITEATGGGGGGNKGSSKKGSSKKTSGAQEPDKGTVEWYNKEIQKRQKMLQQEKHTDDEIKRINEEILDLTKKRDAEQQRLDGAKNTELKTIEDYDKKISELNDKLKKSNLSEEEQEKILRRIVALENTRNYLKKQQEHQKAVYELEARVSPDTFKKVKDIFGDRLPMYIDIFKDAKTDKEVQDIAKKYQNVLGQIIKLPELDKDKLQVNVKSPQEKKQELYDLGIQELNKLQGQYDIGLIDEDKFIEQFEFIKQYLESQGLIVEVTPELKSTKQFEQNLNDITDGVGNIGSALSSIGDMSDDPGAKVAGIIAQAIANIALGAGKAMAQAGTMGPWGWLAFGASIMAQMVAMISQVHSATGYASGGIIQGSTTMGDQILARVNAGEMILNQRQQSNLFNALDKGIDMDTSAPTVSTIKVKGSDLYIALKNYNKITGKTL